MDKMEQFYARLKKSCEMVTCNMPIKYEEKQDEDHSQLKISNDEIGEILISDDLFTHRCSQAPCIMVNWEESKGFAKKVAERIFITKTNEKVQIVNIEKRDAVARQVIEFIREINENDNLEKVLPVKETNAHNEKAPKYKADFGEITLKIWENEKDYGVRAYIQNAIIGRVSLDKKDLRENLKINNVPYSISAVKKQNSNVIDSITLKKVIQYGISLPEWLRIATGNENTERTLLDDVASTREYDLDRWDRYQSTYLPRTYGQAYYIVQNLFYSEHFKTQLQNKEEINILDIGCGNGGATLGALDAILLNLDSGMLEKINVLCIDCNEAALKAVDTLINVTYRKEYKCSKFSSIRLNFKSKQLEISPDNINDIKATIYEFMGNVMFDFVLSFKMVNEIITLQEQPTPEICSNIYKEMIKLMTSLIAQNGVAILTDITMHLRVDAFYTFNVFQNNGIFEFLRENQEYKMILPVSCALKGNNCGYDRCIKQTLIGYINNGGVIDADPILFHCIGRTDFVNGIIPTSQRVNNIFGIHYSKDGQIKLCGNDTQQNNRIINAFDLQDYGREDNNN